MLDDLEHLAFDLAERSRDERGSLSEMLARAFKAEHLKPRQQKRVKERFHQLLANERLIDFAIERATPSGVAGAIRGPVRLLVTRVLTGEMRPDTAARALEWVDWQRIAQIRDEARAIEDPVERLMVLGSLPDWLAYRLHRDHGDAAADLVTALCDTAPVTLRVNRLKGTREQLAELLAKDGIETEPTAHAPDGLVIRTPTRLFTHATFHAGWFELQDEGSQLITVATAPPPGGVVLDACAGAGGKTLGLAAALANKGEILALDPEPRRLADLKKRMRRAGAHNARAMQVPEDHWPEEVLAFARRADRILLDAPCTGCGSMRRKPDMRWRMDRDGMERLRAVQAELLDRAIGCLKPGARVVYATCSLLREENEDVVAAALERHPGIERVALKEILGGERAAPISDPTGTWLATRPDRHGTDGFFTAVLRRPR